MRPRKAGLDATMWQAARASGLVAFAWTAAGSGVLAKQEPVTATPQVTAPPVVDFEAVPYPMGLVVLRADATVLLRLSVGPTGRVDEAAVEGVSTESPLLRSRPEAAVEAGEAAVAQVLKWRFLPGAERKAVITYRYVRADEYCVEGATILQVHAGLATLTHCRNVPDHVPFSNHPEAVVAYFSPLAHPGTTGPSGGVGMVYLSVKIGTDGRAHDVKVVSGPSDLARVSVDDVKTWAFLRNGVGRTVIVGYRFRVVRGRCYRHYAAMSLSDTLLNVIGCTPDAVATGEPP